MQITDKTILIISPNEWGVMHISKHHYALSLEKNNIVYFLNPPNNKLTVPFKIEQHEHYKNLFIVSYKSFFPVSLRFHFKTLYRWLMVLQVKKLNKWLKTNFDIIWCFETNLYWNLKHFKGLITIYHPVDQVFGKHQTEIANSSNYILSVSENILEKFNSSSKKMRLNHGLSEYFENRAIELSKQKITYQALPPYKIGYIGNLFIYALDREHFEKVIRHNNTIEFHIWGPTNISQSNVSGDLSAQTMEFVEYLKNAPNVFLHGVATPEKLSKDIQEMDAFLICYDTKRDPNGGSNTHKMLEYLSTGKVVISSPISSYSDKKELVQMVTNNEDLPDKVKETFLNIHYFNNPQFQHHRLQLALENTYKSQISKIESFISLEV